MEALKKSKIESPVERRESEGKFALGALLKFGGGVRESNPPAPASANARTALKAAKNTSS
jgi:hypothetical protein